MGLRWKDIDFENKLIFIRQTLSHDGKELRNVAKTKASIRSISLPEALIKQLNKERKKCIENKLKNGKNFEDHDLVICTKHGKPISHLILLGHLRIMPKRWAYRLSVFMICVIHMRQC